QGKGKLERWHRSFRDHFLSELDTARLRDLGDLNARLWAWLETVYHTTSHSALAGRSPLQRYQQDLPRIRTLGALAARIDELFYHRVTRHVRKDGTVSYQGDRFEVPYELAGRSVRLVVDPHARQVFGVEDDDGRSLGAATPLDAVANVHRRRHKPLPPETPSSSGAGGDNAVELAYRQYHNLSSEEG
ncbi:MAG: integrase, partial [Pseudomonadota bacterium]|nr:integrase [Pseudomonadota bacterium]